MLWQQRLIKLLEDQDEQSLCQKKNIDHKLQELSFHEYNDDLTKILLQQKLLHSQKLFNQILDNTQDKLSIMQKFLLANFKIMDFVSFLDERITISFWLMYLEVFE